jgi:hypothetical protein
MKVKDSDDLEDIIKILIDLLEDKTSSGLSYEEITLKLRQFHYCIKCKQHFNRCKCDNSPSPSSSDVDDDYSSSIDVSDSECKSSSPSDNESE